MSLPATDDRDTILITGCSSGIGLACAEHLARRGLRVVAGVRRTEDAERLRQIASANIEPVLLDVVDADSIRTVATVLEQLVGTRGLAGLVNNAGILIPGPWELLPTSELRRQFEVNVVGTHAVTQALLPLVRRAAGRIVLMGSISGLVAPPCYGAYAASKHALEAMADSLRMELRPWKISVSLVEPDAVGTALWDKLDCGAAALSRQSAGAAALYDETLRRLRAATVGIRRAALPASAVVGAVEHALLARRPKARYAVGWRAKLSLWGAGCLPTALLDQIMLRTTGLS
jgi:NAD(P)-dependent dehydrogenase (short-subunit alcohol dehydrogenase family)